VPRYIETPAESGAGKFPDLVKALAKELKADGGGAQPLILERGHWVTKSRDVTVIWDKWTSVPADARGEVIVAAYEQAEGKDYADTVLVADGYTPAEALALGLLPYVVAPARVRPDQDLTEARRKALALEARRTVLGPKAKELRYARVEDADAAYRRLIDAIPNTAWAVHHRPDPTDE
jgi:hypothetical protein